MIKSKKDYKEYLKEDGAGFTRSLKDILFNDIRKFKKILRKLEYYNNCKNGYLNKLIIMYLRYQFMKKSRMLGFSIPINVFKPGLSIAHRGTIVVHPNAKVGANCRIHVCVVIGATGGSSKAPIIGDNVYIGTGAKIIGDIKIADNIAIGANSLVNKSFYEEGITIAGNPAKKISNKGSFKVGWNPKTKNIISE